MTKHRHIGSYGIIVNNGKILLIKKSRGAYTGKYDLPGGGFEHGETPEECVKREIMEEVGLSVKSTTLAGVESFQTIWLDGAEQEDLHHLGIIFWVEVFNPNSNKLDADGLDSLGSNWFDIKNLNKQELSPFAYLAITKYKR